MDDLKSKCKQEADLHRQRELLVRDHLLSQEQGDMLERYAEEAEELD